MISRIVMIYCLIAYHELVHYGMTYCGIDLFCYGTSCYTPPIASAESRTTRVQVLDYINTVHTSIHCDVSTMGHWLT